MNKILVTSTRIFFHISQNCQNSDVILFLNDSLPKTGPVFGKHHSSLKGNGSGRALRHTNPDELAGAPRSGMASLRSLFPTWSSVTVDFLAQCLRANPELRPKCITLLQHPLFSQDGFVDKFLDELQLLIAKESAMNPLVTKRTAASSRIYRSSIGRSVQFDDELIRRRLDDKERNT